MHNLGTVFRFEVIRSLKKKSFWIMAISFPVVIAAVIAIIFFSNSATDQATEATKNQKFSLAVLDQSHLIKPEILKHLGAQPVHDKQTGIDKVTDGKLDAFFYYPANLKDEKIEVYGRDVGLFDNGRYEGVAKVLLQQSASQTVSPEITAILQDKVGTTATTYRDGHPHDGFKELIAPGMFLVLFYFLIAMFGNQMLTSTTEEKENRVIEMILTTIEARTLILGKILSLIALAFVQLLIILIPTIAAYLLLHDQLALPSVDLTNIPLDPVRITIGATIFIFSFLLFTGILVAIGAATPTAKEAGSFFGVAMIFMFGPLYAVSLFVSQPDSPLVKVLSLFPLTAPIPLMLRNAVGNLSMGEALVAIVILAISAVLALVIAVRLFRYGALEYSKRLSLKSIFGK